jgi:hypothetical protein
MIVIVISMALTQLLPVRTIPAAEYVPITLTGVVETVRWQNHLDNWLSGYILRLDTPQTIDFGDLSAGPVQVEYVQLYVNDASERGVKDNIGKKAVVQGRPFLAHTGWHYAHGLSNINIAEIPTDLGMPSNTEALSDALSPEAAKEYLNIINQAPKTITLDNHQFYGDVAHAALKNICGDDTSELIAVSLYTHVYYAGWVGKLRVWTFDGAAKQLLDLTLTQDRNAVFTEKNGSSLHIYDAISPDGGYHRFFTFDLENGRYTLTDTFTRSATSPHGSPEDFKETFEHNDTAIDAAEYNRLVKGVLAKADTLLIFDSQSFYDYERRDRVGDAVFRTAYEPAWESVLPLPYVGANRDVITDYLSQTANSDSIPALSPAGLTASPTASAILMNGQSITFEAYNIDGSNYFKLRDLAYALNGTEKQFEVGYDSVTNMVSLTGGKPYTPVGGEMESKGAGAQAAARTLSNITVDGKNADFTVYNIDGNHYFKLRDMGEAFDFGVEWDGLRNTVVIDTGKGYR